LVHSGIKDNNGELFTSNSADLVDVWNSNDINLVRKKMIDGERLSQCQVCYKAEDKGGSSLRLDLLSHWCNGPKKIEFQKIYDEYLSGLKMKSPVSVEVRTGSICNLKCRMCFPTCSVLIEKEYNKIQKTQPGWHKLHFGPGSSHIIHDKYFLETIKNFESIEVLRFSGGEPFLNESTNHLISEAAKSGHSKHIDLFVNTNFTKITDQLLEDLSTFKTVNIDISLDGYKQVHEYIRSGLSWNTIEENLIKLRPYLNENFYLTTNTTVQNLNVLYIKEILEWTITELNITPVLCMLNNPQFLAVNNMPDQMKIEALKRLNDLMNSDLVNNFKNSQWLKGRLTNIIETINLPCNVEKFQEFLYFTEITDKERNQDFRVSVPLVAEYYLNYIKQEDINV
jgi:organic radical activating enzyme